MTATVSLNNVSVVQNTADADNDGGDGGGLWTATSLFSIKNSIIADNQDMSAGIYPYGQADCSGTYTTQGRNKRANRKSEFLLHDAEFLAALASEMSPDYRYPHTELRRAWELVCLNQFHDIIPGSSIGPVYVESLEQYSEVS